MALGVLTCNHAPLPDYTIVQRPRIC
jgi:hypothetical protein